MKIKQNLSILIWANSSKINKNDLIPVYALITIDGKRAEISLNKKILPEKWDKDSGLLKTKDMEAKAINQYLLHAKSELNIHFINLCVLNEKVTIQMLRDNFLGKEIKSKEKTFMDAFEYHNRKFKEKAIHGSVSIKTWGRFEILKNKVIKFLAETYKEKDRNLSSIKHPFYTLPFSI